MQHAMYQPRSAGQVQQPFVRVQVTGPTIPTPPSFQVGVSMPGSVPGQAPATPALPTLPTLPSLPTLPTLPVVPTAPAVPMLAYGATGYGYCPPCRAGVVSIGKAQFGFGSGLLVGGAAVGLAMFLMRR